MKRYIPLSNLRYPSKPSTDLLTPSQGLPRRLWIFAANCSWCFGVNLARGFSLIGEVNLQRLELHSVCVYSPGLRYSPRAQPQRSSRNSCISKIKSLSELGTIIATARPFLVIVTGSRWTVSSSRPKRLLASLAVNNVISTTPQLAGSGAVSCSQASPSGRPLSAAQRSTRARHHNLSYRLRRPQQTAPPRASHIRACRHSTRRTAA